jgi:hypothetical protein
MRFGVEVSASDSVRQDAESFAGIIDVIRLSQGSVRIVDLEKQELVYAGPAHSVSKGLHDYLNRP